MFRNNVPVNGHQIQQQQTQVNVIPKSFSRMCLKHHDKELELFCKTCKIRICVICEHSRDLGHQGHNIDLIKNLKPEMLQKGELYRDNQNKVIEFQKTIFSVIEEKAKKFEQGLRESQRNQEIKRLKSWFLITNYREDQQNNLRRKTEEKFLNWLTVGSRISDYKNCTDAGLQRTIIETLEQIQALYSDDKFELIENEANNAIEEQSETLEDQLRLIENQENLKILKLKSSFSITREQNQLMLRPNQRGNVELNLDGLEEISSISIQCRSTSFCLEDWNLLKLILLSLKNLDSISLDECDTSFSQKLFNGHGPFFLGANVEDQRKSLFTLLRKCFHLGFKLPLSGLKKFSLHLSGKSTYYQDMEKLLIDLIPELKSLTDFKISSTESSGLFGSGPTETWNTKFPLLLFQNRYISHIQINMPNVSFDPLDPPLFQEDLKKGGLFIKRQIKFKNYEYQFPSKLKPLPVNQQGLPNPFRA